MLRRDFCFLSLGSVLAGTLGSSAKEVIDTIPIYNITYEYVNLLDAEYIITKAGTCNHHTYIHNGDEKSGRFTWELNSYKESSKNIVCYIDSRNKKHSICAIRDNEFTNEYIIYKPYQWVNSWGSYES